MCDLSANITYVQTQLLKKKNTRNHCSLRNKQNLAEKEASRHDPNNHQNKVCQLSGTVQRRSMGNWTEYENVCFWYPQPTLMFLIGLK